MDERTRRKLAEITARVPEHLRSRLVRRVEDHSQMERAQDVLKSRHATQEQKDHIRGLMAKGAFRPMVEEVVDEGVAKQIEDYHEKAVAAARRNGELSDPKDDAWLQKRKSIIS